MEEVLLLLENFWILREEQPEAYYRIKDKEGELRSFFREKLGYSLIINSSLVRVVKTPGEAQPWMGIQSFSAPLDYSLLFLVLAFLEDKGQEEQFVLSDLTEYIVTFFPGEQEIDWTIYQQRRSLVRVLQYVRELGLLRLNDGSEQKFSESEAAEVLYESTGLSRYFLPSFAGDITELHDADSFLQQERGELAEERGLVRRHRVYRKLFLSPVVNAKGSDDPDFLYIKNYKQTIERDVNHWLDAELHVHRHSASLVLNERRFSPETFPQANNNLADIVLKLAHLLREGILENRWTLEENGCVVLVEAEFRKLVADCHRRYSQGWYKSWREKPADKLTAELAAYLESWEMASWDQKLRVITIRPFAVKIVGEYPEHFAVKEEN